MIMRKLLFIATTLIQLMWPVCVRAESELEMRANIEKMVSEAFQKQDYETLERTAKEFRVSKARTSSGLWKLTLYYAGIVSAIEKSTGEDPSRFATVDSLVSEWTKRYPESPTAWICQSLALKARGWAYRGGGYANTVPKEAWKPFFTYVGMARTVLEKHKDVASSDPKWYEEMLTIATVESWDKSRFLTLIDEALKREPVFYQTYFSALDYLLPKWGGNVAEVELFALAAVRRTSQLEGKGMYARIYWYSSQSQFGNAIFQESMARWPSMRAGFDDVVAKYPDSWNLNNFAKFSCLAGDAKKLRELMKRVEKNVLEEAWGSRQLYLQCRELANTSNTSL